MAGTPFGVLALRTIGTKARRPPIPNERTGGRRGETRAGSLVRQGLDDPRVPAPSGTSNGPGESTVEDRQGEQVQQGRGHEASQDDPGHRSFDLAAGLAAAHSQ